METKKRPQSVLSDYERKIKRFLLLKGPVLIGRLPMATNAY